MNPAPNVMSQDLRSLTLQQQTKPLRGSSERIYTAITQLACGLIAVGCGLVLVILRGPRNDFYGHSIERLGNTAFGVWGGLVFIATAIPYFFGRDKKPLVGLYFGFSLASAVIAAVGLGLSVTAIYRIVFSRSAYYCNELASDFRYQNPCCFEPYRYDYDCSRSYNYYNYWSSYQTTTKKPLSDYNSVECDLQRQFARNIIDECLKEVKRSYVPHLIFHGILIVVVSVELLASVYGAGAALSALCSCKCCTGGQPTPYFNCSLNQLTNNDSLNNMTVPPPVTIHQPGPAIISTSQVPQMSPQRPLGHSENNMYEVPNI